MDLDQIRALAGIPMHRGQVRERLVEAKSFAPVKADGHFDFSVDSNEKAGKVATLLAVEGLPVDLTYDGVGTFFFNFKNSELKAQAEQLVKKWISEQVQESTQDESRWQSELEDRLMSLDGSWTVHVSTDETEDGNFVEASFIPESGENDSIDVKIDWDDNTGGEVDALWKAFQQKRTADKD